MGRPNDSVQSGLYNSLAANDEYRLEQGVCVLPLAQEPPTDEAELSAWSPVVILRLHAPYRVRKVTFGKDKQNNPPVIPTPADAGKFVLVGGSVFFQTSLNTTCGNFDWLVAGEYEYVENCVSRPRDGFVLASQPFSWSSDLANSSQYGQYPSPEVGAISEAAANAVAGYNLGLVIGGIPPGSNSDPSSGTLALAWGYNCPAFFPAVLMNDELVNGGVS